MGRISYSIEPAFPRPPLCACAPLLWWLVPFVATHLAARMAGWPALLALVTLACSLLLYLAMRGRSRLLHWMVGLSVLCAAGLAALNSSSPAPDWELRAARASSFEMVLLERFNARKADHVAGMGRITSACMASEDLVGREIAFYLRMAEGMERVPLPGARLVCTAVIEMAVVGAETDDYIHYLNSRGVYLNARSGIIAGQSALAPLSADARMRLQERFQQLLAFKSATADCSGHVLASMLLGKRSFLSDARIDLYKKTGTFHLFAVSGLHVGGVALCLMGICSWLRMRGRPVVALVLAGVWSYVWLTGASPSAQRAGIMISAYYAARILLRQPHIFPAWVLSACMVLVIDPRQLWQLGFQLSYAVVASIVLIGLPAASALDNRFRQGARYAVPAPAWLRGTRRAALRMLQLVVISCSATLGSMPLIIDAFALFTPAGWIAGVLLAALVTGMVMLGCCVMILGLLPIGVLPGYLALAAWPVIQLMEWVLALLLATPGAVSTRQWLIPGLGAWVLIAVLALAAWMQWQRQQGHWMHPGCFLIAPALLGACIFSLTQQS